MGPAANPRGRSTHLATGLVVMQIHGCPGILSCLQGIDELLGYCFSEAHVVTATSPQPALAPWKSEGGKVAEQAGAEPPGVLLLIEFGGVWDSGGLRLVKCPVCRLVSAYICPCQPCAPTSASANPLIRPPGLRSCGSDSLRGAGTQFYVVFLARGQSVRVPSQRMTPG